MIRLSRSQISSYAGDIVPVQLLGDGISRDSEISWSVTGDSAYVRDFKREGTHAARNCALVCLCAEGTALLHAKYGDDVYEIPITVRAMTHTDSDGDLNYYFADLHAHTSPIHNHELFAKHENEDITDYIDFIKNDPIDLSVISDHAGVTNDYDFFRGFDLAETCESTVVLAGAESEVKYTERDRFDILHRHSGEILTLMSKGYGKLDTWEELEQEIDGSPAPIAIFAHPNIVGFSTNGMWNFDFRNHTTDVWLNAVRGIETIDGSDRDEFLTYEYCYSAALDAGFRVSPTADLDSHGPVWGYGAMAPKTVIMAPEKSREAFHDALLSGRFYSTETGNVKLRYSVNGKTAPADLGPTDTYSFHVELDSFIPDPDTAPVSCQIISDYGRTVARTDITQNTFDMTVRSDSARYFYLRLTDAKARHTWSCPVWCGRAFDAPSAHELEPIDMSLCTATCTGTPAQALINGDPLTSWHSGQPRPRIVIDMGKIRDIAGFGYFPHMILRDPRKGPQWRTAHEACGIVTQYKLSSSLDGVDYSPVCEQVCRYLGDENLTEFDCRSARYLAFEVLSTVGADSERKDLENSEAVIGELTVYAKKG